MVRLAVKIQGVRNADFFATAGVLVAAFFGV
jgi:hypothetical protein